MSPRDAVITGIGLVSCLGEGAAPHRAALEAGPSAPVIDTGSFAPYSVHPLPEIDWSLQIPKRGDQRQMETWQRIGTYAAGLALDDAGMKGDEQLCATMDMIVAAAARYFAEVGFSGPTRDLARRIGITRASDAALILAVAGCNRQ